MKQAILNQVRENLEMAMLRASENYGKALNQAAIAYHKDIDQAWEAYNKATATKEVSNDTSEEK